MKNIFKSAKGAVFAAIICNILWGSAYPGIKLGYAAFSVGSSDWQSQLLFAGLRFSLAGLAVLIFGAAAGRSFPRIKRENLPNVLLLALIYTAVQYIFFYIGLAHTSGTNGSIVNSSTTFIAVILAPFIYKDERITVPKAIGCVLGFLGVLTAAAAGGHAGFSFFGEGFIFIAACCFVIGGLISRKASVYDTPISVTGWNMLLGGILLCAVGFFSGGRLSYGGIGGVLSLLYLAFLSSAAFTLWNMLLKYRPLSSIAVYNFVIPVTGTLLSSLLLGEDILRLRYLISLVLVCAGIIITNRGTAK